jgi:hypothetical protein
VVNEFKNIPNNGSFMDSKNEWWGLDLKLGSTDLPLKEAETSTFMF